MSERPPISPRSPRAALEPEQVPPPPKRSERARNPFVIVGNAIITIVLVVMMHSTLGVEKAAGAESWLHPFIDWARPFRMPKALSEQDLLKLIRTR